MGAFVVILSIAFCTLWLGGFNLKVFAALLVALPLALAALILSSPYRMQRVIGFMDPWSDPYGKGYQLSHALIAFGRGEWLGVGLGGSVEKLFYLPEAHTDFLMAVIAEELGLAGVTAVIALFALLVVRAFQIGRDAAFLERNFSALVAAGDRRMDRLADDDQYRREHGCAADQRSDAAVPEFRRQRHRGELHCGSSAAEGRLRESAYRARTSGMKR